MYSSSFTSPSTSMNDTSTRFPVLIIVASVCSSFHRYVYVSHAPPARISSRVSMTSNPASGSRRS
jgi:hypothetical protein